MFEVLSMMVFFFIAIEFMRESKIVVSDIGDRDDIDNLQSY